MIVRRERQRSEARLSDDLDADRVTASDPAVEVQRDAEVVGRSLGGSVIITEIWLFICFVGVFFERLSSVQIRVG